MADETLLRDQNHVTVIGGITDDSNEFVRMIRVDPATGRVLVSATGIPGSGTVTSVSVVNANGFNGTVASASSTPAITISTSITGLLQGNGTAISAVTIGSGLTFVGGTLSATGSGSGSVTAVSVVTANGFSGTVANSTTTPVITLSTTITGILQGNGTTISATPTSGSGSIVLNTAPTITGATLTTSTVNGVTLSSSGSTGLFLTQAGTYVSAAGGGTVTSVATDTTLTGGPITATGTLGINLANANTWTAAQTYTAGDLLDKGEIIYDVKAYGAKGDGTTHDSTAINATVAAMTNGGVLYFPPGTYIIDATINVPSYVIVRGSGRRSTRLFKNGNTYPVLSWTSTAGNNLEKGGGEHFSIEGNAKTGFGMQLHFAQTMFFRDISIDGFLDTAVDMESVQDSYFFQVTANTNHNATAPVFNMYGSAGWNTNMMWFCQCRIEDFWSPAVSITQGAGNAGGNNGFFFVECKFESTVVGGDMFVADSATEELHMDQIFMSATGFKSGFSTPVNAINSACHQLASYRDIFFNAGSGIGNSTLKVVSTDGTVVIDNVLFNGTAVTSTVIFNGTSGAKYSIGAVSTTGGGAIFSGTNPGNYIPTNTTVNGTLTATTFNGVALTTGGSSSQFLNGVGAYSSPPGALTTSIAFSTPGFATSTVSDISMNSNTTAWIGRIYIPVAITFTKFSFNVEAKAANGTFNIALFSDSGATQLLSFTSGTVTATGIQTTTVSSTILAAGYYYVVINPVGTASCNINIHQFAADTADTLNKPSGLAAMCGTITVTASTMPATITPTAITPTDSACLTFRLDA